MRILITGVTGMLGSRLFEVAREQGIEAYGTSRRELGPEFPQDLFPRERIVHLEPTRESVIAALDATQPTAVINCLGVIKSAKVHVSDEEMMLVNAEFPHLLAQECSLRGIRMVQVSTDCVFSGKKGDYSEEDTPDPVDVYGRSKLEGEVYEEPHLTIRTSIIGIERGAGKSLISWFLSNPAGSSIKGFRHAIWSGLTTRELSRVLLDLAIGEHKDVNGLLNIAGEPVDKHTLLHLFKKHLHHDVEIAEDKEFRCDRSLQHGRMDALGITVPPVEAMVAELAEKDI